VLEQVEHSDLEGAATGGEPAGTFQQGAETVEAWEGARRVQGRVEPQPSTAGKQVAQLGGGAQARL
jgi:hypothetical protein